MTELYKKISDPSILTLIAGPCVIESGEHCLKIGKRLKEITAKRDCDFIFKSSFDKANRSSHKSYRGPGLKEGLKILREIKDKLDIMVTTDFHLPAQAEQTAGVVDILQVPAFLCRQTDMIKAAAQTGSVVNVKKGQFLSPQEVENIVNKAKHFGNERIIITERGHSFGYNNLVVDFRSFQIIKGFGCPVIFDTTHSLQLPGGEGDKSGGQPRFIRTLSAAACGAGINGVFIEVHDTPSQALCDGANSLELDDLPSLLDELISLHKTKMKFRDES